MRRQGGGPPAQQDQCPADTACKLQTENPGRDESDRETVSASQYRDASVAASSAGGLGVGVELLCHDTTVAHSVPFRHGYGGAIAPRRLPTLGAPAAQPAASHRGLRSGVCRSEVDGRVALSTRAARGRAARGCAPRVAADSRARPVGSAHGGPRCSRATVPPRVSTRSRRDAGAHGARR